MKKILTMLLFAMTMAMPAAAQNAKKILDKTAAVVGSKGGASASFNISGGKLSATNGTISIKGNMFHAKTPAAVIWFDGKTSWTYMKNTEEVNVSNPTASQLASMNPYSFINLYKNGYNYTAKEEGSNYEVHLTATGTKNIQEMYITVNKTTYVPSMVRMRQGKNWTTIKISNFKTADIPNATFRFNSKDYPKAEIIDLR
ncbi:MAG: outer-membrane lipoprotein carrier protein LolA [Prevotella sp.]|nr:outer-membrane lipoprotein carrier protein LolA [Prevotella sp.]